jgi:monovalent cation:H+ antiporter, CPA1 family
MHEASPLIDVVSGIILLLIIAALLSAIGKKIRLPFTVMLVVVGVGITLASDTVPMLNVLHSLSLSPDIILYIFLPTLIFESSFNLDARQLWRNILPVLTLAVPGLLISTGIIGGIVSLATGIPLMAALLLGAILSATDPVAVIALFRKLGAPQRLTILVEGESLFNDATAIVLASILIAGLSIGAVTETMTVAGAAIEFFSVFLGGMGVGLVLGVVTSLLLGMVRSDVYIETTLTTILAYASFILAEHVLHVSGVVAVVMAGLTLGNWGRIKISPEVRNYIHHFWEYMAYVATALIFLMVGMRVNFSELWQSADILAWVILGMLISRAIVIYGMIPLSNKIPGSETTSRDYQHVMYWGGLRGAIALAIVLSIPAFPLQDTFIAVVMGAVLFTLLVQGLSIEWLVAKLGLNKPPLYDQIAEAEGRVTAIQKAISRLPELQLGGHFSGSISSKLQQYCKSSLQEQQDALQHLRQDEMNSEQEVIQLYLRCYANEQAQYNDLFNKGHLSEATLRSLLGVLVAQIDSVRFQGHYESIQHNALPVRRFQQAFHHFMDRHLGSANFMEHLRLEYIVLSYEEAWGHFNSCQAVLKDIENLESLTGLDQDVVEVVRQQYMHWKSLAEESITQMAEQYPEFVSAMQERLGMRLILLAEIQAIRDEASHGNLPAAMAEQMADELYLKLWTLRGQEISRLRVEPNELLKKVPFFSETSEEDFLELSKKMKRHSVAPHEEIIRQGDRGDRLYLIARGVVRISREQHGESHDLTSLFAGDFFGEMALLHDDVRTATVTSVTPCTLYELERKSLQAVMENNPSIRIALENADQRRRMEQVVSGMPDGDE